MDKIREQPSNTEAERAVLGTIICESSLIEKAQPWIQSPDAFWRNEHKRIWECMLELRRTGTTIDSITLMNIYKDKHGDFPDLSTILRLDDATVYDPANIEEYSQLVWNKHLQREYNKTTAKINEKAYGTVTEFNQLLNDAEKLIQEIRNAQPSKLIPTEVLIEETVQHLNEKDDVIPFNIPALDKFAGGMTKKEITIIGGRPSHGKSTLSLNIVKAVSPDIKVMMFNREMSNTNMLAKIIAMESTVPYSRLRDRELDKNQWEEIETAKELIKVKYKNFICYDDIQTLDEAIGEIRRHKPDLVIDDYIQLVRPRDTNLQRRFQIEEILHEYKWVAKTMNIPIILISQLSREVDKRILDPRPKMSDYAEAGTIEQVAENCLFCFRPWVHDSTDPQNDEYLTELISAKVRYGRIGAYNVGFDGNACTFYNTVEEARINRR